jgi:hypothetical protein
MIDRIASFFSSLRLTVVCLALALLLVFIGTLAQVKLGLYVVQSEFFRSVFIYWRPEGASWKIPVFPGGWLIGGVLLINLLAAHAKRFQLSYKKTGIFMTHAGLILLLIGQFLTEVFQVESTMRIEEGASKNYSEDARAHELALIDVTDSTQDMVYSIPESRLRVGSEIRDAKLPVSFRVKAVFENALPAMRTAEGGDIASAKNGVGSKLRFQKAAPTASMDDENKPTAVVEVTGDQGVLGEFVVSTWLTKHPWPRELRRVLGNAATALDEPQRFTYKARTYEVALRPVRYYKPYTIALNDFTHERYKGTDIPKNFSSQIHLHNPSTGEDRDHLIYMNNPLRYGGETYYQGGFEPGDTVTILQVVRNPAWVTPYLACLLVGFGLGVQFLMHLYGFAKRRTAASKSGVPPPQKPNRPSRDNELASAGERRTR